jgi:hypothetical protein
MRVPQNKGRNVGPSQVSEPHLFLSESFDDELAGVRHIVPDSGRRQPALAMQVLFVPTQNVGQWGVGANRPDRTGNNGTISEMSQKLPQRFSITSMDPAFSLPAPDERRGVALIKLSDANASASQPTREIGKQSEFGLHRDRCIAILSQRCCK